MINQMNNPVGRKDYYKSYINDCYFVLLTKIGLLATAYTRVAHLKVAQKM